jgi:hypothetical protein
MLNIDCQKLIVSYTDPIIYRSCYDLDPKNYSLKEYNKFLIDYDMSIAKQIEIDYNKKKLDTQDQESMINIEIYTILEILNCLENYGIIEYERSNTYVGERSDLKILKFKLKFLVKFSDIQGIQLYKPYNKDLNISEFISTFVYIEPMWGEYSDCQYLKFHTTHGKSYQEISCICHSELWKLLAKILIDQRRELY